MRALNTAMIFAAGRGERMRPLTDSCPKPLLKVGGKALIAWQIERLAAAGFEVIVINHAWLGRMLQSNLGNGSRWGVEIRYSHEMHALETAGGIAQALPLLETQGEPAIFLAVSGDVFCDFDYASVKARAPSMATASEPAMHLVMVPNPPFHTLGDFALEPNGTLSLDGPARYTFGNIGLYDTRMFRDLAPNTRKALTPYYQATVGAGRATGELFEGQWENVGTAAQLEALDRALRNK
jgi:MurNAc alpha-1-phosphate uridylyltransferase